MAQTARGSQEWGERSPDLGTVDRVVHGIKDHDDLELAGHGVAGQVFQQLISQLFQG